MYYITISNGLLDGDHQSRMGTAVWQYMWCIDKVTMIDEEGWGHVLGGKPVNLADFGDHVTEDTVSRNLHRLQDEGYIRIIHTPYGIKIMVARAKKRFGKNVERGSTKMSDPHRKNVEPNIRQYNDKTVGQPPIVPPKPKGLSMGRISAEENNAAYQILEAFQIVNRHWHTLEDKTWEYEAALRMAQIHGLDQVLKVIRVLPKTNRMKYVANITTPSKLEEKWSDLENQLYKQQDRKSESTKEIIT